MSGCIGPESCSTRGFRVVVGGILGGCGFLGLVVACCGFLGSVGACWGSMRALL